MKNIEYRLWDNDKYTYWNSDQGDTGFWETAMFCWNYPEQFSGLLDKNGMKIFLDSDIISFKFDGNVSLSGTLTFNDEEQRVEVDIDKKYEQDGWICLFYDCMRMKDTLIIGNIHQNKELIN